MPHRRTVLLAPLLLVARCAAPPPQPPTLALTIHAGANQNPDPAGRPTPVAIRIYQLAALGAFERADVYTLMDREAEALGADRLASDEIIVAQGATHTQVMDLKPNTRFIGAVALFRAIDRATWRVHVPAAPNGPTRLTLVTSGLQLTVSPS